jgi:signal transduction histidine kinase
VCHTFALCRAAVHNAHVKIERVRPDDDLSRGAEAELLSDVLALQPALVCRWLEDGTVLLANDAYAAALGRSAANLVGQNWVTEAARMGQDTVANLDRLRQRIVDASADGAVTEVSPMWGQGPSRWMQWTNRRIPDTADHRIILQSCGLEVTELRSAHLALHALAHELALRREEERRELAHRLHDDVVQPLISATWAMAPGDDGGAVAAGDAERAVEMVRNAVEHLRRCLVELTAPIREAASMAESIAEECGAVEASGVSLAVRLDEIPNGEVRGVVTRVVNEALRNVRRHSNATAATVSVDLSDGVVVGAVADNGVGASDEDLLRALAAGHVGLLTSRSLVEALGGEFAVRRVSSEGGAMVRFSVPIPPRPRSVVSNDP